MKDLKNKAKDGQHKATQGQRLTEESSRRMCFAQLTDYYCEKIANIVRLHTNL